MSCTMGYGRFRIDNHENWFSGFYVLYTVVFSLSKNGTITQGSIGHTITFKSFKSPIS